ncbi:MAG: serine/threonine protein kinase [Myxococcales bacterium]|nr:serine/threonine protein kinase [Myxococcales bacterium]
MVGDAEETQHGSRGLDSAGSDETISSTAGASRVERRDQEPRRGALVGRYLVLSRLGAGAMGVVLVAYDPELDRKVALKLLRMRGDDNATARVRLQREAQALARLSHPNVVTVHDVGLHEGRVFLTMELVEGQTLGAWMRAEGRTLPRPWREVVPILEAAGRGLHAAHIEGLVHRDFKPDNVMVGDDGRVRVMDFGLARAQVGEDTVASGAEDEGSADPRSGASLTRTGALMGTPAYMAPEQFGRGSVTARSDQYSFCATLYEALFGVRPVEGETPMELASMTTRGELREPPRGVRVPKWLRRVVLRGLSLDPEGRYADMAALLAALGTGEARRRRNRWLVGGTAGLLAVGGVVGAQRYELAQRVDACTREGEAIDQVWNPEAREALRAGLVATGVSYAPTVATNIMPWIDRQARAWREQATAACLDATVERRWDAAMLDEARWCLEDRRLELATLVRELPMADEQVVPQAVQAAVAMTPVETCTDETFLAGMGAPPAAELRPQVARVREQLSHADYLERAGRYEDGLEVVREARREAEALQWPPLVANALVREASLLKFVGRYEEAERVGITAYVTAARSNVWHDAEESAADLVFVVGYKLERPSEGKVWAEHAAMALAHSGDPLGIREAYQLTNLGAVQFSLGEDEEAEAGYQRALAMLEAAFGPDNPHLATPLNNLGTTLWAKGRVDEAEQRLEQALAIRERELGPDHPNVASTLNNLGRVRASNGQLEQAVADLQRAIAIWEATLGPMHPLIANASNNLGLAYEAMGRHEDAIVQYERVLAIREAIAGPEDVALVWPLCRLGQARLSNGEPERSKALLERALGLQERATGPSHPDVGRPASGLGEALSALGAHREALELLERAVVLQSAPGTKPGLLASSRFALARALWDAPAAEGGDRARARALAEQAREAFAVETRPADQSLAKVDAWLAAHPG